MCRIGCYGVLDNPPATSRSPEKNRLTQWPKSPVVVYLQGEVRLITSLRKVLFHASFTKAGGVRSKNRYYNWAAKCHARLRPGIYVITI